jgi:rhamnosyl/mannosyltransferase
MKVLQVGKYYPPHWGGMETALKDISESLAGKVQLEVLVANQGPRRDEEPKPGFHLTRLPRWRTLFSQPLTPGLLTEFFSRRADIVHLHEPNPLALACYLLSHHQAKLVLHYHSDIVRQRYLRRLYAPILQLGLQRAEAIIVGSSYLRDHSPVLAPWKHKCVVIPFGIDLRPLLEIPAERPASSQPQILAVGRLAYYKGFQHLIEAMSAVPARLVIAGDGELRDPLARKISELGLSQRVTLLGRISNSELIRLYRQSDLFCMPSCEPSEAFGLAAVEGMAAALPVVSTDLPTGVRLVNRHGQTGLVVPPRDVAALSAALQTLAGNRELRLRYGRAGRERAKRLFNRDLMARNIFELYRKISDDTASTLGRGRQ